MTKHSLTHSAYLYEIHKDKLEKAHANLEMTRAVLYFLSQWILESPDCSLEIKDKDRLDSIVSLLLGLASRTSRALPIP